MDEATSARVAHILREQGIDAHVIRGGLEAWKKAGLPLKSVPAGDLVDRKSTRLNSSH